jgi:hypothetical protein
MTDSRAGEPLSKEEQKDKTRDDREPGAPGLPGDESFAKVEDTPNPENLAGDEHDEEGQEEQVPKLVGVYEQEGSISED